MKIKIIFTDILHNTDPKKLPVKEYESNCNNSTNIQELLDKAEESVADLSAYYYLSQSYAFNNKTFPYIIKDNNKVSWNLSYEETKISEFLYTHKIKDNTLYAKTGIPQAGGPGLKDISEIWSMIYPVIDQFVTVVGLISITTGAGKWIRHLFEKKKICLNPHNPPHIYFDFIFSRNKWNHFELAGVYDGHVTLCP